MTGLQARQDAVSATRRPQHTHAPAVEPDWDGVNIAACLHQCLECSWRVGSL